MATTKVTTAVENSTTMTAGAGDVTSSVVTLDDGYGAVAHMKLTNGTGPTVAAQIQIQVSGDNSEYYDYGGPFVGTTTSSDVTSWAIPIPINTEYVRFVHGSNTGQDVTVDIDLTETTKL